jgi:TusA-related sulfurtransferase
VTRKKKQTEEYKREQRTKQETGGKMAEQIDARGLSCPQPVVITKNRMDKVGSGVIEVTVDTATARDNITRLAENQGWRVEVQERGEDYLLTITK